MIARRTGFCRIVRINDSCIRIDIPIASKSFNLEGSSLAPRLEKPIHCLGNRFQGDLIIV